MVFCPRGLWDLPGERDVRPNEIDNAMSFVDNAMASVDDVMSTICEQRVQK